MIDPDALATMRQIGAEVESLERRRGRPLPPGSPLLATLLSSPPGTPFSSPLPPLPAGEDPDGQPQRTERTDAEPL